MSSSNKVPREDTLEEKVTLLAALVRAQQQLLACVVANSTDPEQIIKDFRESSAAQHEVLHAVAGVRDSDIEAHALASTMMLHDLETLRESWKE